jgi:hypothetical protein
MKVGRVAARGTTEEDATSVRASISFPPEGYGTIEEIVCLENILLAWVVRDTAELYIADKWPLLRKTGS